MSTNSSQNSRGSRVVVACRVMEPELEKVRDGDDRVELRLLDQGLHRTPQKMPEQIQEQVDLAAEYAKEIVLGYGLCSNGIVGVTARQQGLIVPRCHDCITFFLGSPKVYQKIFKERPGTYYLTPGWIAEKKDPLGIVEEEYAPRYGQETANWVMEEQFKNYTHVVLINTGVGELGPLQERALENARFLKKKYDEIQGSLEYFEKLIRGSSEEKDFIFIEPDKTINQDMFLQEDM